MTLAVEEFIRRFLIHVLPRGFHRIRQYGLPAGSARKASLALARELLDLETPPDDGTPSEPDDYCPPWSQVSNVGTFRSAGWSIAWVERSRP